ncbi:B12-binding domain-containing radical SAM protein [Candidatus Omnitrophota bacterium]
MHEKVLLINPAINPSSQRKIINSIINTTFPTSLGSLAGYLTSKGVTPIRIIDEQLNFIHDKELEQLILSLQPPRIIGLSVLTISSKRAYLLAKKIKKIDPKAVVVLGGIHPTVMPEEALRCEGVDIVVRKEGEETFAELVSAISDQKDYSKIAGISLRKNGSIAHNPDRPMIIDLDAIPPFPYHLFEENYERYPSFGSLLTSRGCPYNCIFCSSRSVSGKQYRYFSVERIISEIKLLVHKYNQKTIWMLDDNIAGNPSRFLKLLDAIIEAKLPEDVNFHGSMRADNINDEILDKAKAANFKMIAFGLETGCESLMSSINKGETVNQVIEAIKKTDRKGIAVATTIIFGLPDETRKNRRDTIKTVHSLPLSSVRYNILTPYPGTPVFKMLCKKNELFIKKDWENFAVQYMWESNDLPYVPKNNDTYELIFDTMLANLSFYLSFKGIRRAIKNSFAGGNVIKLSKRWYLSPRTIWHFMAVIAYLSCRFLHVSLKMHASKLKWFDRVHQKNL